MRFLFLSVYIMVIMLICPDVFCADEQYVNQKYSINKEYLQTLYNSIFPREIRRNFEEYIDRRDNCKDCFERIMNADFYPDVYSERFIVFDVVDNDFGGHWAYIAVKKDKDKIGFFRLWLYDIDRDVYELREIYEFTSSRSDLWAEAFMKDEYEQFFVD